MANRTNPFSRIRLVYRRSGKMVKAIVLALVVLSTATLLTLGTAIRECRAAAEDLRLQAAALEQDNARLQENIDALGTIQSVKQIAREELGLVDPDTVIFEPVQ